MLELETIRNDHSTLAELLAERRAVTVETLPVGARLLWGAYLILLEDGVKILSSMIEFLENR